MFCVDLFEEKHLRNDDCVDYFSIYLLFCIEEQAIHNYFLTLLQAIILFYCNSYFVLFNICFLRHTYV